MAAVPRRRARARARPLRRAHLGGLDVPRSRRARRVAHVAAWEDRTARRIRAFRETGRQIGPEGEAALGIHDVRDTDGFNAKVASSHRLVGAEALVDELDTAHRRLTEEIARLTDDQLCADVEPTAWGPQSWVVAVVAGNSFGHYREHAEEMGIARSGEGPRG